MHYMRHTPSYTLHTLPTPHTLHTSPTRVQASVSFGASRLAGHVLQQVAFAGHADLVERLLNLRPDLVDLADAGGHTALLRAAAGGDAPTVRALVKEGANVSWRSTPRRSARGETAMEVALRLGNLEAATALLPPSFVKGAGQALNDAVSIYAAAMAEWGHARHADMNAALELRRGPRP